MSDSNSVDKYENDDIQKLTNGENKKYVIHEDH